MKVEEKPKIEVGKTYPDRSGHKWECLFILGDVAFMSYDGYRPARFYLDGTPIDLVGTKSTIDLGPVRGEVVRWIDGDIMVTEGRYEDDTHKITIPTLDGQPAVGTYTGENGLCVKIEEVK